MTSTPLALRRNTAAALASLAGVPGEAYVDTTNNRLVAQDGATLGGYPHARIADLPGQNALINGSFYVNQRGQVSGTALAAGAYGHDRWKAGSGGCTYSFTQSSPDTTLSITAGSLVQVLDTVNVYAPSMWLSWFGTAQARVYQGSAGAYSAGTAYTDPIYGARNRILVTGLSVGTIASVEFSTGTVGMAQLEAALPNAGPARYERRQNELALCQRYYELFGSGELGQLAATTLFLFSARWSVYKRALPTIGVVSPSAIFSNFNGSGDSTASGMTVSAVVSNDLIGARLNVSISSFSPSIATGAIILVNQASPFYASAEL